MFSSEANHSRMSGPKVHEHHRRVAEVKIELTMLGAFFRTVQKEVFNRLATDYMSRICSKDGNLIRVF